MDGSGRGVCFGCGFSGEIMSWAPLLGKTSEGPGWQLLCCHPRGVRIPGVMVTQPFVPACVAVAVEWTVICLRLSSRFLGESI